MSPVVWVYLCTVLMPVEFSLGSVTMGPLRLLLMCMMLPMIGRLFSGQVGKVMAVDYLFFIHILWATIAVGINNPNRVIENAGSTAVEFLGGYLLARTYVRSPFQMETVVKIIVVMTALSLPFAIAEARSGHALIPNLINKIPGLRSVKQVVAPMRHGLYRVQFVFAHPIHYGLFCSVGFSLLVIGLRDRLSVGKRVAGAVVSLLGVFLSLSSGALLAVIMQIGLATWARIFSTVKHRWRLLLGLIALAYVVVDLISNRTPIKVLMSYATFSAQTAYYRSIIFEWGMKSVWGHPIFGLGLNDWVRPAYMITGTVDNYWLLTAMRYGIPGFLLVALGYLIGMFKVGFAQLPEGSWAARMRYAWILTFCGMTFSLTTVHVWSNMYSFVFFFYGTGMWMIDYNNKAPQPEQDVAVSGSVPGRQLVYKRGRNSPTQSQRSALQGQARTRSAVETAASTTADQVKAPARNPYTRFPPKTPR